MRYTPTECFETFPFPNPDPRVIVDDLEEVGRRLYDDRARFMVATNQGLTATYNQLKDPDCAPDRPEDLATILHLRQLHEDLDRAVLAAYGWSDIAVPPYCPATDAERAAVSLFEDTVIDRLFALNAERAAEERGVAKPASLPPADGSPKPKAGRKSKTPKSQTSMLEDD
jgi:hypothetical protein